MCLAPLLLRTGVYTACHECWQCRSRAIEDWVGRNIAESKTAKWSRAITLTYGRNRANDVDHERAVILTYSDVQKWLKLLRRHGFPVRYFVTGEFGSAKGRAHWHVMLYGQGDMPEHPLDQNFNGAHWPHGWSFWTKPTSHAVRYNCKYIQKDMGDDLRHGHLAMSKKPPLGAAYFEGLAERYVMQGLAPQTLEYSFPDVKRRNKEGGHSVVPFMLTGRSAELFLDHYLSAWGDRPRPKSPLVDFYEQYGVIAASDEARERRYQADLDEDRRLFEKGMQQRERDAGRAAREEAEREAWLQRLDERRFFPGQFEVEFIQRETEKGAADEQERQWLERYHQSEIADLNENYRAKRTAAGSNAYARARSGEGR